MAAGLIIPELLNHYNVYNDASKLVGVSGDVELPDFEAITETIEGAGVLGEIEAAATGQFSSMTIKIPFSVLYEDMFTLVNSASGQGSGSRKMQKIFPWKNDKREEDGPKCRAGNPLHQDRCKQ